MGDTEQIWRARLRARKAAQRVIDRYAIEAPEHILVRAISMDLGLSIVEAPLRGATARLIHSRGSGLIRVSSSIHNEGRKRFSIAHELGHFLLQHPGSDCVTCVEDSMEDFGGSRMSETEANFFAVELLMPEDLVRGRFEIWPVDLRPLVEIAADFRSSITSTVLRFVQLTTECAAAVYSVAGSVRWTFKSPNFKRWLPGRGAGLHPVSGAFHFFKEGKCPANPQRIPADTWVEFDSRGHAPEMVEHSMAIPSLGAVLTLLWIEDGGDDDLTDEESDDPDIEWSPYDALQRKRWPK